MNHEPIPRGTTKRKPGDVDNTCAHCGVRYVTASRCTKRVDAHIAELTERLKRPTWWESAVMV